MISINRIISRVRVPSKAAFPMKLMSLLTFNFCVNVRMIISNRIAVCFGVNIKYIDLR